MRRGEGGLASSMLWLCAGCTAQPRDAPSASAAQLPQPLQLRRAGAACCMLPRRPAPTCVQQAAQRPGQGCANDNGVPQRLGPFHVSLSAWGVAAACTLLGAGMPCVHNMLTGGSAGGRTHEQSWNASARPAFYGCTATPTCIRVEPQALCQPAHNGGSAGSHRACAWGTQNRGRYHGRRGDEQGGCQAAGCLAPRPARAPSSPPPPAFKCTVERVHDAAQLRRHDLSKDGAVAGAACPAAEGTNKGGSAGTVEKGTTPINQPINHTTSHHITSRHVNHVNYKGTKGSAHEGCVHDLPAAVHGGMQASHSSARPPAPAPA